MKTILALEASSDAASVAILRGGTIVAERQFASKRSLSADLFPVLSDLLVDVSRVDQIVVGLGPGSYAGVRITIAAAIGLQCVWRSEVVGIPSVAAFGEGAYQAVGDARRGTWYYAQVEDGVCLQGPMLLESAESLREAIARGRGPVRSSEVLAEEWNAGVCIPRASVLARLASLQKGIVQRSDLEPLYLRDPHITVKASS